MNEALLRSPGHVRLARSLDFMLLAYQSIHIFVLLSFMSNDKLDHYDAGVALISMLFCSRRLMAHFASSLDPFDLGPRCWLLLRGLLMFVLCANAGHALTRVVQRHSLSAMLVVAGPAVLSLFETAPTVGSAKDGRIIVEMWSAAYQACESAYYVGTLPVALVKHDHLYWDASYTRSLTLVVAVNSAVRAAHNRPPRPKRRHTFCWSPCPGLSRCSIAPRTALDATQVILLLRLLVLNLPQLTTRSQALHALWQDTAYSGFMQGHGSGASNGVDSIAVATPTAAVRAMRLEEQPLLLRLLLVDPDRGHIAIIGLQSAATAIVLVAFLHTHAWKAAAACLWCNFVILYVCLRMRSIMHSAFM